MLISISYSAPMHYGGIYLEKRKEECENDRAGHETNRAKIDKSSKNRKKDKERVNIYSALDDEWTKHIINSSNKERPKNKTSLQE